MGACGCGEQNEVARFPGPDDTVYVLEIYPGCSGCDESPCIAINKLSKYDMDFYDLNDLSQLKFREDGIGVAVSTISGVNLRNGLVDVFKVEFENQPFNIYDVQSVLEDGLPEILIREAENSKNKWLNAESKHSGVEFDDTGF